MKSKRETTLGMLVIRLFLVGVFGFGLYAGLRILAVAQSTPSAFSWKPLVLIASLPALIIVILLVGAVERSLRDLRTSTPTQPKTSAPAPKAQPAVAPAKPVQSPLQAARQNAWQERQKQIAQQRQYWLDKKAKRDAQTAARRAKAFDDEMTANAERKS